MTSSQDVLSNQDRCVDNHFRSIRKVKWNEGNQVLHNNIIRYCTTLTLGKSLDQCFSFPHTTHQFSLALLKTFTSHFYILSSSPFHFLSNLAACLGDQTTFCCSVFLSGVCTSPFLSFSLPCKSHLFHFSLPLLFPQKTMLPRQIPWLL